MTKTINVTVQIQMDVREDSDSAEQAREILDLVNTIISSSELETQPQIFTSDISRADIIDVDSDED
jgi:hypothetical protein